LKQGPPLFFPLSSDEADTQAPAPPGLFLNIR
jgi:hypothetical protein